MGDSGILSALPCGTTQHVRRMRSSIVSMIQSRSRVQIHACDIFQVISALPFSAKNTFVTVYLLESYLAQFKNVACCFPNYLMFPKL